MDNRIARRKSRNSLLLTLPRGAFLNSPDTEKGAGDGIRKRARRKVGTHREGDDQPACRNSTRSASRRWSSSSAPSRRCRRTARRRRDTDRRGGEIVRGGRRHRRAPQARSARREGVRRAGAAPDESDGESGQAGHRRHKRLRARRRLRARPRVHGADRRGQGADRAARRSISARCPATGAPSGSRG